MRIVVTSSGDDLESAVSPIFGRSPSYLLVDTDSGAVERLANPAVGAAGGAGIQAAEYVVRQGAQAVLTGNVGPNAFDVLSAAGVAVYLVSSGTVAEAVSAFRAGSLAQASGATARAHSGSRRGGGRRGRMSAR
jgi:predicted Fe-Mo cluster-binding NifX family protein